MNFIEAIKMVYERDAVIKRKNTNYCRKKRCYLYTFRTWHTYFLEKSGSVIIRENTIQIGEILSERVSEFQGKLDIYKDALFFDLEHYVYKKPICIGVFGCCYYDEKSKSLMVTQYMIENKKEAQEILLMAEQYFIKMYTNYHKKYIVTFSGNNDFTVINYLFKKKNILLNHLKNNDGLSVI